MLYSMVYTMLRFHVVVYIACCAVCHAVCLCYLCMPDVVLYSNVAMCAVMYDALCGMCCIVWCEL